MEKGFWGSLFDFSFSSFITPKLVKFIYILLLVLLALAYVGIAIAIFSGGGGSEYDIESGSFESSGGNAGLGIAWLIVFGPLMFLLYTLLYRVFLELIIVVFRIYETLRDEHAITRLAQPALAAQVDAANSEHHPASPQMAAPTPPQAPPTGPPPPPPPAG